MITKKFDVEVKLNKKESLQKLLGVAQEFITALTTIKSRLDAKYNKRVKFNLELMVEHAVDAFYDSYAPHMYDRQEDLYNAAKVIVNDEEWSIDLGPQYMKGSHKIGNDYIYVNSFTYGYHGGAIDGPDHPDPGTPWWKLHGKWYLPATQGPSPEEAIEAEDPQGYIEEQEQAYVEESISLASPYFDKFLAALNEFYGR